MAALARYRIETMPAADRVRMMARATAEIFDPELNRGVAEILEDVRMHGDAAVCRALGRFDGVDCRPDQLRVSEAEFSAARKVVSAGLIDGIRQGIANIRAFNERVLADASWTQELAPGLLVGEQARPIESAALFNPSIVPHLNQHDLPDGALRFIMSLRATGEGHVSSIVFRTGIIYSDQRIQVDPLPADAHERLEKAGCPAFCHPRSCSLIMMRRNQPQNRLRPI